MKPRTSPLSEDAELVEKWLEDQPNVRKLYNKVEYDEMKSNLQEWVGPKLEGSGEEEPEGTNYTNTPKEDVNKQLDSLFDED